VRLFIAIAFQLCFRIHHNKKQKLEDQEGLEMNRTHHLLDYADVNFLGINIKYHKEKQKV
jgi:hypothetical protein